MRLEPQRALDREGRAAQAQRLHQGELHHPRDDLLRPLAEETGDALERVEHEQDEPEGEQEGEREERVDELGLHAGARMLAGLASVARLARALGPGGLVVRWLSRHAIPPRVPPSAMLA